jgi:hypothetical protein
MAMKNQWCEWVPSDGVSLSLFFSFTVLGKGPGFFFPFLCFFAMGTSCMMHFLCLHDWNAGKDEGWWFTWVGS